MAPTARILAVANCKGGCGKTTTSVNVAAELAARGWRTLLIDLDPQGHCALALGARGAAAGARAHDLLMGAEVRPEQALRLTATSLDLLPADPDFRTPATSDARAFARSLAPLTREYDAIVIDTPPAADLPLIGALAVAEGVIAPTQLTPLARDGVERFAQVFFYVSTRLNPALRSFAVLPTQADLRTRVQQVCLARLIADFGVDRVFPIVRHDTAVAEAFASFQAVRAFRPASRGALDYARLVDCLLERWFDAPAQRVA